MSATDQIKWLLRDISGAGELAQPSKASLTTENIRDVPELFKLSLFIYLCICMFQAMYLKVRK